VHIAGHGARANDRVASLFYFRFLWASCLYPLNTAFHLINDIDIPETEKRLAKLRQENAAFTALNAQRDARDALSVQAEEERTWREQQERAKEARLEEEEERLEREREKKEIIDSLVGTLSSSALTYKGFRLTVFSISFIAII
jgi:hypothetical protein